MPIFVLFLVTHAILILGSIALHITAAGDVMHSVATGLHENAANPKVGVLGILGILLYAYSMGSGTYTGMEAVSNSMPVMREPRVATAQRTMRYMAWSLAFTAGGLIVAYLLLNIEAPKEGETQTMNSLLALIFAKVTGMPGWGGTAFVLATLLSEGTLLVVAAQAGFIDGPRVLGNMAHDSWMPQWFANLSERLATYNGILLMGLAALAALWYTEGIVSLLVLFYSINVFVTFSLSMIGMCRHWWELRHENPLWARRLALFVFGAVVCVGILITNVCMKLFEGGWMTVAVTSSLVAVAYLIHSYYRSVGDKLKKLNETLTKLVAFAESQRGRARPRQADGRDPGEQLRRPGRAHDAQQPALRAGPLQQLRLRLGGRGRFGQFQRQRRCRGIAAIHRGDLGKVCRLGSQPGHAGNVVRGHRHGRRRCVGKGLPGGEPGLPQGDILCRTAPLS